MVGAELAITKGILASSPTLTMTSWNCFEHFNTLGNLLITSWFSPC